LLPTTL